MGESELSENSPIRRYAELCRIPADSIEQQGKLDAIGALQDVLWKTREFRVRAANLQRRDFQKEQFDVFVSELKGFINTTFTGPVAGFFGDLNFEQNFAAINFAVKELDRKHAETNRAYFDFPVEFEAMIPRDETDKLVGIVVSNVMYLLYEMATVLKRNLDILFAETRGYEFLAQSVRHDISGTFEDLGTQKYRFRDGLATDILAPSIGDLNDDFSTLSADPQDNTERFLFAVSRALSDQTTQSLESELRYQNFVRLVDSGHLPPLVPERSGSGFVFEYSGGRCETQREGISLGGASVDSPCFIALEHRSKIEILRWTLASALESNPFDKKANSTKTLRKVIDHYCSVLTLKLGHALKSPDAPTSEVVLRNDPALFVQIQTLLEGLANARKTDPKEFSAPWMRQFAGQLTSAPMDENDSRTEYTNLTRLIFRHLVLQVALENHCESEES